MIAFIDECHGQYGIEPICAVLPISPSTYYTWKTRERDPSLRCERFERSELLREHIVRVRKELDSPRFSVSF